VPPRTPIIIIIIIIIIIYSLGIETADKWFTHMPKPVYEKGDVTLLWNQAVHTDREITANRPGRVRKISPPPEFDPRTVQSKASRYTD
jgi:hypothetical protein